MRVLSLFDGIACARQALHDAGIEVSRYISYETDRRARECAMERWPGDEMEWRGDVVGADWGALAGEIDLLVGGSPCQDLSAASGTRPDLEGSRSRLFWEYVAAKKKIRPRFFLLENVRVPKKIEAVINAAVGVEPHRINSKIFTQQNRPRCYWTDIPVPPLPEPIDWPGIYRRLFRPGKSGITVGAAPALMASDGNKGAARLPQRLAVIPEKDIGKIFRRRGVAIPERMFISVADGSAPAILKSGNRLGRFVIAPGIDGSFERKRNSGDHRRPLKGGAVPALLSGDRVYQGGIRIGRFRAETIPEREAAARAAMRFVLEPGSDGLFARQRGKDNPPRPMRGGVVPCITGGVRTDSMGHSIGRVALLGDGGEARVLRVVWVPLTPEEGEELQGLPQGYTAMLPKTRRWRVLGDGFTVPVIAHILSGIA